MHDRKKITIIGAGVMGSIFAVVAKAVFPKKVVAVSDSHAKNLMAMRKKNRQILIFSDNLAAIKKSQVIFLAVKPQSFVGLSTELKGKISKDCLVVSIMAGVPIAKIQEFLRIKKVVRAMPNVGARVGKSVTVWMASKEVNGQDRDLVRRWFGGAGFDLEVKKEKLINSATALTGSGPGFFFALVEEWIKAAVKFGFSKEETQRLLFSTIDGASALLQKFGSPEILRQQVTSKGGTTEAGLKIMQKSVPMMWRKTLAAASKRALELSR